MGGWTSKNSLREYPAVLPSSLWGEGTCISQVTLLSFGVNFQNTNELGFYIPLPALCNHCIKYKNPLHGVTIVYYFFCRVTSADHKCVKTRSQDPMLIYFTSGSTGSPKMVVQSHSSYGIGFATSGRYTLQLRPVSWLSDMITVTLKMWL